MDNYHKIETEAEAHITLGNLLRKKRGANDENRVAEIVNSNRSIKDKIRLIQAVDAKAQGGSAKPQKNETPVYEKNRYRIKLPVTAAGFFEYLFKEYKQIKDFGKKSHIYSTRLFPPKVQLNPEVISFLTGYIQKTALDLLPLLEEVHNIGWRHLTKRQYNLVGLFYKLVHKIAYKQFQLLSVKDRNIIESLKTIENTFLVLHSHDSLIPDLIRSLQIYLEKSENDDFAQMAVTGFVERILKKDVTVPCFYYFIQGCNLIKYRKYLELHNMIKKEAGQVINTDDFECSPAIKAEIRQFYTNIIDKLEALEKQKKELNAMKEYLPSGEDKEVIFEKLGEFYTIASPKKETDFEREKENIILFTQNILEYILTVFSPFLLGYTEFMEVGNAAMFTNQFFHVEMSRLKLLQGKFERIAFNLPGFPRKRYLTLKAANKGAIEIEADALQITAEIVDVLIAIAEKLQTVLQEQAAYTEESDGISPLDPIVLQGKEFVIPHKDRIISGPHQYLRNKRPETVIRNIITLFYLTAAYFYNPKVLSLLGKESSIDYEIRTALQSLERLAPEDVYNSVHDRISLVL